MSIRVLVCNTKEHNNHRTGIPVDQNTDRPRHPEVAAATVHVANKKEVKSAAGLTLLPSGM
jgi:hypothetical protein